MEGRDSKAVDRMTENELRQYLNETRTAAIAAGQDLSILGVAGLSNQTSFYDPSLTKDALLKMATEIESQRGKKVLYEEDYTENMRQANI
jgi:hypothetical protein